jgi:hypothetical protein
MISLQIEIDEETDLFLAGLAQAYGGDRGNAVMELIRAQQRSEEELDEAERIHHDSLVIQRERSERGFREGRFTTWEEVKRRNGL